MVTFPGSALGAEGEVLRRQLARFMASSTRTSAWCSGPRPTPPTSGTSSTSSGSTPQASEPDILQLDVVWTPEFAAAGWILDLDRFRPPIDSFFPATIAANRGRDALYAMPWFVDVGMLYWRTDLMPSAAGHLRRARAATRRARATSTGCRTGSSGRAPATRAW